MTTNILILSRNSTVARWRQLFADVGANAALVDSVEAADRELAAGGIQMLVVDVVFAGEELQVLHRKCQQYDVEVVLAVDGVPGPVHYERAMSLSALGVISASESRPAAQKLLDRLDRVRLWLHPAFGADAAGDGVEQRRHACERKI